MSKKLPGAKFLDLFAGTGLMGLEALSRGAGSLTAVEESRKMVKAIEINLKRLGFEGEVICADVRKTFPVLAGETFDIIFADPPYQSRYGTTVLHGVGSNCLLSLEGTLIIEHARADELPESLAGLVRFDERPYGQTALSFFRWSDEPAHGTAE